MTDEKGNIGTFSNYIIFKMRYIGIFLEATVLQINIYKFRPQNLDYHRYKSPLTVTVSKQHFQRSKVHLHQRSKNNSIDLYALLYRVRNYFMNAIHQTYFISKYRIQCAVYISIIHLLYFALIMFWILWNHVLW